MNYYQLACKSLNLDILNCINQCERCPLPTVTQNYSQFSPYPQIIGIGDLYGGEIFGKNQDCLKVMFIGNEPIIDKTIIRRHIIEAGTRLAYSLLLNQYGIDNNPFDNAQSIPIVSDKIYKKILTNFHEGLDSIPYRNQKWKILDEFEYSYYKTTRIQNHYSIWDYFLGVKKEIWEIGKGPGQYEVNTNYTLCASNLAKMKPDSKMRHLCKKQNFLARTLEITDPEVIFCFGSDAWDGILNEPTLFGIKNIKDIYPDYYKSYPFQHYKLLKIVQLNGHNCLIQRIPHFQFNKNSNYCEYFRDYEPAILKSNALEKLLKRMAKIFRKVAQTHFPNIISLFY